MTAPLPLLRRSDHHAGALDEQLARSLRPIALVLSGAYLATLVERTLLAGPMVILAPTAVVPMVAFLLVGLLPGWRPIPGRLANPVLVMALALVSLEAVVSGRLVSGTHLHWALIGLGAVVLRPRWGLAAAAAVVAPWAMAAWLGVGSWSLADVGFALDMVTASAIGTVVFVARRRAVLGLVMAGWDLSTLATTDPLTGLRNRRGLEQAAIHALAAPARGPLGLVYVDLDDFKAVNDRLGHAEGDRALVAVADVLRSTFRAADVIARTGGDEFVVLVAAGSDADVAAARLQERLAGWHDAAGRYRLHASVGTGAVPGGTLESFWSAVADADRRMYADKAARRGTVGSMVDVEPQAAPDAGSAGQGGLPMLPALG